MKNNQLRPTAIQSLAVGGFDDRFIATISKHRDISSLRNYDPAPEMSKRAEAAQAIMTVKRTRLIETVTTEITKKVSRTSVIEAEVVQKSSNRK